LKSGQLVRVGGKSKAYPGILEAGDSVSLQYFSKTSYRTFWDRVLGLEISTPIHNYNRVGRAAGDLSSSRQGDSKIKKLKDKR
jgi:hypothetical protein